MEMNTVVISLEKYNELVRELDLAKVNYSQLEAENKALVSIRNSLGEKNRELRRFLIESYIDDIKLRFATMDQCTDYRDKTWFGINENNVETLLTLGVGINEMIYYIKLKKQIMLDEEKEIKE